MPLGPRIAILHAVRREVEMVDVVAQLGQRWTCPARVALVVDPLAGDYFGSGSDGARERWDLSGTLHRKLAIITRPHVQKPALDLGSDRRDFTGETRRREQLAVEKHRVIDREEESANAARFHYFDIQ